ncbi:MAG: OB-fold nucleic acid binding domain-containing protein [Candidatus Jordarchaeales archaeon]
MSPFEYGSLGKPPVKPHAVPKDIKDISPSDGLVRVIGVVVESTPGYILIDDGTGVIRVALTGDTPTPEIGKVVRIFGSVAKNSRGDTYINAEIVQDMSVLDLGLYRRVKNIKKRGLT